MNLRVLLSIVQFVSVYTQCTTSDTSVRFTASPLSGDICQWRVPSHVLEVPVVGLRVDVNTLGLADTIVLSEGRQSQFGLAITQLPAIVRVDTGSETTVSIHTVSSEPLYPGSQSMFHASAVTRGWCEGVCANKGRCTGEECRCLPGWTGIVCTTPVTSIAFDTPTATGVVLPGSSAYFSVTPTATGPVTLSLLGTGDVVPMLLISRNASIPTNDPRSYHGSDVTAWVTRSSFDQVVHVELVKGSQYAIRVANPAWRSAQNASGVLLVGFSHVSCPFGCRDRGLCSLAGPTPVCRCNRGWTGPTCQYSVDYIDLSLDSGLESHTVEWRVRPGHWAYAVANLSYPSSVLVYSELLAGTGHYVCAANDGRDLPHGRTDRPPDAHSVTADYTDPVGYTHSRGSYQQLYIDARLAVVTLGIGSSWGGSDVLDRWSGEDVIVRVTIRRADAPPTCRRGVDGAVCSGYKCGARGACLCPVSTLGGAACTTAVDTLPVGVSHQRLGPGGYAHYRLSIPHGVVRVGWTSRRVLVGLELGTSGVTYPLPTRLVNSTHQWGVHAVVDRSGWILTIYNAAPTESLLSIDIRAVAADSDCTGHTGCGSVGLGTLDVGVGLAPGEWMYWLIPNGDSRQSVSVTCDPCNDADLFLAVGRLPGGPGLHTVGFGDRFRQNVSQTVTLAPCRHDDDESCLARYMQPHGTVYGVGALGTTGMLVAGVWNGGANTTVVVRRVDADWDTTGVDCSHGFTGARCGTLCPGWTGVSHIHTLFAALPPNETCSGRGVCTPVGKCACSPGWDGSTCSTPRGPVVVANKTWVFRRPMQILVLCVGFLLLVGSCVAAGLVHYIREQVRGTYRPVSEVTAHQACDGLPADGDRIFDI